MRVENSRELPGSWFIVGLSYHSTGINMLHSLYLKDFRSYTDGFFTFAEGLNVIIGNNATGKTNLLEAISLLTTGRSFKSAPMKECIAYDKEAFRVEAALSSESFSYTLRMAASESTKRVSLNGVHYPFFSAVLGILPSTFLVPKDILLITGAPSERRRFLDILLAQSDPLYIHHLTRYTKALKQRNALLKQGNADALFPWDQQLICAALFLIEARKAMLSRLNETTHRHFQNLACHNETVQLDYAPSMAPSTIEEGLAVLHKQRHKDLLYQNTRYGPHRDDFEIQLSGKTAKTYASEGQKRCILAALKLGEWELLRETSQKTPLFCIDDFGAHLDAKRQSFVATMLQSLPQLFITTTAIPENMQPAQVHTLPHQSSSAAFMKNCPS